MPDYESPLSEYVLYSTTPCWMKLLELPFVFAAFISVLALATILITKRPFHKNFIVVFMNLELSYLINMTTRIISIAMSFEAASHFFILFATVEAMNNMSSYSVAFNMVTMVVERVSAVLLVGSYEKFSAHFPYYGICLAVIQWMICTSIVEGFYHKWLPPIPFCSILYACYAFALLVFCFLPKISARMCERRKRQLYVNGKHSLSERYQLAENERTAKFLRPLVVLISLTTFIAISSFLAGLSFNPRTKYIFFSIYHLVIAIQAIMVTIVSLRNDSRFHAAFLRLFTCPNAVAQGNLHTKSISTIKPIGMSADEERRLYFESYAKAWCREFIAVR